jgi:hypothetical protein
LHPGEHAQLQDIMAQKVQLVDLIFHRACRDEVWRLFSDSTDIVHFTKVPEYLRVVRRRIRRQMSQKQVPTFLLPTVKAVVVEISGHLRSLKKTRPKKAPRHHRSSVQSKKKQRQKR